MSSEIYSKLNNTGFSRHLNESTATNATIANASIGRGFDHDILKMSPVLIAISSVLTSATMILNIPIIIAILTKRSVRKNFCIVHVLSLSISDMLVGLGTWPIVILIINRGHVITSYLCAAADAIFFVIMGASTLHLLAICVARCWAVRQKTPIGRFHVYSRTRMCLSLDSCIVSWNSVCRLESQTQHYLMYT
jgi:hypothetical protein